MIRATTTHKTSPLCFKALTHLNPTQAAQLLAQVQAELGSLPNRNSASTENLMAIHPDQPLINQPLDLKLNLLDNKNDTMSPPQFSKRLSAEVRQINPVPDSARMPITKITDIESPNSSLNEDFLGMEVDPATLKDEYCRLWY